MARLARSWSHTLVYFGLRDDPAVRERLEAGPTTAREVAALALAVALGAALAFGLLALLGIHLTWRLLVDAVGVFALVTIVTRVVARRRATRSR
jgi:hypothetical protein